MTINSQRSVAGEVYKFIKDLAQHKEGVVDLNLRV